MTREEIDSCGVFNTTAFWNWVVNRRATDNPRGDFIRDTRSLWAAKKYDAGEMAAYLRWNADEAAKVEGYKLAREFLKQERGL